MRRFVFQTLVLILAMNGIACACPVGSNGDSELDHNQHSNMHSDNRADANTDDLQECCDTCESPDVVKRQSEKLSTINLGAEPFDIEMDAIASNLMLQTWHSLATSYSTLSTQTLPLRQSPVFLFDLMLD